MARDLRSSLTTCSPQGIHLGMGHARFRVEALTCSPQGIHLGVGHARFRVEALPDDLTVLHDDTAHCRVGEGVAQALLGQLQSLPHELPVLFLN